MEIRQFSGDPTKWQTFYDLLKTSVQTLSLSDVHKFIYLFGYLVGDTLGAISGLAPTSQNYTQALELLEKRFGNPQLIISHINTLVKLPAVREQDGFHGLRTFYDQINSHVRSLSTLGVASEHYGPRLSSIILEKGPPEIKLLITRNMNKDIWDLTQMLRSFNQELKERETCLSSAPVGKSSVKYIFCKGEHWSDKFNIVTDPIARKKLCFQCLNKDHLSGNCKRSKTCFYCKRCHNSAICTERKNSTDDSQKTDSKNSTESSTNFASGVSTVTTCEKQIKVKVLFDQGSQRSHVTKRVKDLLILKDVIKKLFV